VVTANTAEPIKAGWLRRAWERVATVLAVIGLIDVSSQLIHWAKLIHEIAEKYAIVRSWLFGWLPFHIPPEWHDPIVLFLIFFSVTNLGYYQTTKNLFMLFIVKYINTGIWDDITEVFTEAFKRLNKRHNRSVVVHQIKRIGFKRFLIKQGLMYAVLVGLFSFFPWFSNERSWWSIVLILFFAAVPIAFLATHVIMSMLEGAFVAWRWLLTTAAIFGALVAINQVYVLWLEPLAEH
jgi:hypothetical protein